MPTQTPPPLGRTLRRSLALASASLLGFAAPADAADWYLNKDQPHPTNWGNLPDWNSKSDNSGTTPAALYSTDTYHTDANKLRSPDIAGTAAFPGAALVLDGGEFIVKSLGVTLPKFVSTGGTIRHSVTHAGQPFIQTPVFENRSGTVAVSAGATLHLRLDPASLFGAGSFDLTEAGTVYFSGDATSFLGDIKVTKGIVNFDGSFSSAGKLVVGANGRIALDENITVTGLTLGTSQIPVDTYPHSWLSSNYPTFFTGTGAGSITVRSAKTWYLAASQSSPADWTQLAHWNADSGGTGVAAPSVNAFDSYVNQTSGRVLRSPSTNSQFNGKSLALQSGGVLTIGASAGQTSTVSHLLTSGTSTVNNGAAVNHTLAVTKWDSAGTTTISPASGSVLQLRVGEMLGTGNLVVGGSGQVHPYFHRSTRHTGSITVNSGAHLVVNTQDGFGTGGALIVNSGATVTLNEWAFFTSLTVNGVARPLGSHSAASLGLAGTAGIIVYPPNTDPHEALFGVNLAGAEFAAQQWQTNPEVWDYYASKGLTLIRMPVKWHVIQPTIDGPVNFTKMDECIALARARGMKVIIDLHNFGAYGTSLSDPRIGTPQLPISKFVNVWTQIAEHYKDEPAIYGYDLMNEPVNMPEPQMASWTEAARQALNAIRLKDQKHYVIVERVSYSNDYLWTREANENLDLKDPVERLIYSPHSYWDYERNPYASPPYESNDGTYQAIDHPHPQIGVENIAPFVDWLTTRPYARGLIGEFGIPHDHAETAGWRDALYNFLLHLREKKISATYWAGGKDWGTYPLSCHPYPFPGPDKPMMAELQQFNNTRSLGHVFVDNLQTGTGEVTLLPGASSWANGTMMSERYGPNYYTDSNAGKGSKSVKFTPTIPQAGNYEVFMRWPPHSAWATNAPVRVDHNGAGSPFNTTVNQRQVMSTGVVDGIWNPLGTFAFNANTTGGVTISNSLADNGTVIADAVWLRPSLALPPPWIKEDVGLVGVAGGATYAGGVYTVTGSGANIGGTVDSFHFVRQPVTGDCVLTARVFSQTNTNPYARAGVMIREGTGANAKFFDAMITPANGHYRQYRSSANGTVTTTNYGTNVAPYWLRVTRSGNNFTAEKSTDGVTWLAMGGAISITMGARVEVGLVVCSFNNNALGTVEFDNVSLTPAQP